MRGVTIKHVGGCGNVAFYYAGPLQGELKCEHMILSDGSRPSGSIMCGHCMQPMLLLEILSALQDANLSHYVVFKKHKLIKIMLGELRE